MEKNKYYFIYQTKLTDIAITEVNNKIISLEFDPINITGILMETDLIKETYKEILEYLSGARKTFDIPYEIDGTLFQKEVLELLTTIKYGETKSYKDIATKLNHSKAYRAVGSACNRNKLPLIIPCHRVIGASGNLVGYAGGLELKKELLELEKKYT